MMKKNQIAATFSLGLVLCACGGEPLSNSAAKQGFDATLTALIDGRSAATRFPDSPTTTETDVAYECSGGGAVTFPIIEITDIGISCTRDGSTSARYDQDFETTATFENCVVDGVAINGSVTWEQEDNFRDVTCTASGTIFGRVLRTSAIQGVLEFSGQVEGTCVVDISWASTDDEFTGTICGFDAGGFAD